MRALLPLLAVLASAGCVRHEAAVSAPPAPAGTIDAGAIVGGGNAALPLAMTRAGHLPQDIGATAWYRDRDGALWRADGTATTALPWWQRFPADAVTSLLPVTLTVPAATALTPVAVPRQDGDTLTARARAAGYDLP
jgi:hypothetical protein